MILQSEIDKKNFAELLLNRGANLDINNQQGDTPFDLLINYVEEYPITEGAKRLASVSELLSKCKDKEVLQRLNAIPH